MKRKKSPVFKSLKCSIRNSQNICPNEARNSVQDVTNVEYGHGITNLGTASSTSKTSTQESNLTTQNSKSGHDITNLGTSSSSSTSKTSTQESNLTTQNSVSFKTRLEKKFLQFSTCATNIRFPGMKQNDLEISFNSCSPSDVDIGPFFGLPSKVRDLICHCRKIKGLYEWQEQCLKAGLSEKNLLISLPTSSGKTLVAEILMLRRLLLYQKDALFILPYISLVQEKVRGLCSLAVDLNFIVDEYAASKGSYPPKIRKKRNTIYIATIEKANSLIESLLETSRMSEVGLVVIDEIHMLSESSGRGAKLESTITKLKHFAGNIQLVSMSATVGNLEELATFLNATLFQGGFRPVPLTQYLKVGNEIAVVNPKARDEEELLEPCSLNCTYKEAKPSKIDQDMLTPLVEEIIPQHSCLIFCPSRNNTQALATMLCSCLPKSLLGWRKTAKISLLSALKEEGSGSICPVLRKIVPFGLGYHHSGLTEGERKLLEEAFIMGTLCCVVCTSTLAAGVNLPARRVIIRAPYMGRDFLTRARYHQMIGRAGRAGLDSVGESFMIVNPRDVGKQRSCDGEDLRLNVRSEPRITASSDVEDSDPSSYHPESMSLNLADLRDVVLRRGHDVDQLLKLVQLVKELLLSPIENCVSKLTENESKGLTDLLFSMIGLQMVKSVFSVMSLANDTLLALQADKLNVDLHSEIMNVLEKLRSQGLLRSQKDSKQKGRKSPKGSNQSETVTSDKVVETAKLEKDDHLIVCRVGKAAIKGSVELRWANRLYYDLVNARASLAVHSHLHLLYLVTPYDPSDTFLCNPETFYCVYSRLTEEEREISSLLGVTNARAVKISMGMQPKQLDQLVLQRFYAALLLHKLLSGENIWDVSEMFQVQRGMIQNLFNSTVSFAYSVLYFCEELQELWAFRDLLSTFTKTLSICSYSEITPLLSLPAVKFGRAKLLYKAGFKNLAEIAKASPQQLVNKVEHLSLSVARQIISSAKMLLLERANELQEEAEDMLLNLTSS